MLFLAGVQCMTTASTPALSRPVWHDRRRHECRASVSCAKRLEAFLVWLPLASADGAASGASSLTKSALQCAAAKSVRSATLSPSSLHCRAQSNGPTEAKQAEAPSLLPHGWPARHARRRRSVVSAYMSAEAVMASPQTSPRRRRRQCSRRNRKSPRHIFNATFDQKFGLEFATAECARPVSTCSSWVGP
ncbi:hypothetical protein PR003_g8113 [Phytophthora rubi]|uniref:Uncharacterized protein n=1 Tax=Phytophthora rubi TaxID=129364 RepID=A0A6A4FC38_9STRA|nr:hypothetical protein PR002_g14855 [Phytophthora rubi]KAE9043844.1 hypothetical protein PR001_g5613 [Phytophthora rubi]KAE9345119.1 hypothetical protein PR003_g8113 [Phytophthora rubi]